MNPVSVIRMLPFKQPSWASALTLFIFLSTHSIVAQPKKKKLPAPPSGVTVTRDLVYSEPEGALLALDLYLPVAKPEAPLPVVVWIHGGGWLKGSKDRCKADFLATRGFAVASIAYRLTDVAQWPSQIEDCYSAIRWLRKNANTYGLDAEHIGVFGSSAGGHLASLVGTRPAGKESTDAKVQAVCNWFGPADLLTMPPNVVSEDRSYEQVASSNGAKLLGAPIPEVPELAKDASALYQVTPDDPPFLIMHGSDDPGVPLDQSILLHQALKEAGVDAELYIVEGAGHGGPEFTSPEVQGKVIEFFTRTLRGR